MTNNINTDNDISIRIEKEDKILLDEKCCTAVNIILTNDGNISTSFMGSHNKNIIKFLSVASKKYFKQLNKKLIKEWNNISKNDSQDIKIIDGKNPVDKD